MGQHNVQDPEALIEREFERKKLTSTKVAELARAEFVAEYFKEYEALPNWTVPTTHWLYNAWLAAQGEREWLTEEEKQQLKVRQVAHKKRMDTMKAAKAEQEKEKAQLAKERRAAADAEYKRIRKDSKAKKEKAK